MAMLVMVEVKVGKMLLEVCRKFEWSVIDENKGEGTRV
jgi:hypothetical protein